MLYFDSQHLAVQHSFATMLANMTRRSFLQASLRASSGSSSRKTLATAAAESSTTSNEGETKDHLGAYMLLSRPPVLLPEPTPLESAYYAYNAKLQRALAQPFPRELYFKKGSAAETQFLGEEREREETMSQWGKGGTSASVTAIQGGTDGLADRRTKADESNDLRSLDRSLDRTLFLVVRDGKSGKQWSLPRTEIERSSSDALHKAAKAKVEEMLGEGMDIWTVTNMPVGLIGVKSNEVSVTSLLAFQWPICSYVPISRNSEAT